MDPILLSGLISGGTSLLSGLLGGAAAKQKMKQEQKMRTWSADQVRNRLMPKTPYYNNPYLPALGDTAMRGVMGNLMQRLGPETAAKWGIDAPDVMKTVGANVPFSQTQAAQQYAQPQKALLQAYGFLPAGA